MKSDNLISILEKSVVPSRAIDDLVTLNKEHESFFVCNVDDIIQKFRKWKSLMPRVKPHYAVKCNDHPVVLKVLAALGLGFDCASKREIYKVLALGVDPSRIIYAHTTKPKNHLNYAANSQVKLVTFDNELELYKIRDVFPDARTLIRIKYDDPLAKCVLGHKFGCEPIIEAPYLLQVARDLNINVVGVSFHIGSGSRNPSIFRDAIKTSRYIFDAAKKLGYDFELLDIGGGFPGEMNDSIKEYSKVINQALNEHFSDESIKIISEPGRYFVESAFTLACNVHSKKHVNLDGTNKKFYYYINDSIFGGLNPVIFLKYQQEPQTLKNYKGCNMFSSTIMGQTCHYMDIIMEDVLLPELGFEDWLIFSNIGAYSIPIRTQFNGFEIGNVHSFISSENWQFLKEKVPLLSQDFTVFGTEKLNHTHIEKHG